MHLSLSSAAAPDAALSDLLTACTRRGLGALELVEGNAHGVGTGIDAARAKAILAAARHEGIRVCGLYLQEMDRGDLVPAARLAAALEAPVVIPTHGIDREILSEAAVVFGAAGAQLLLAHGSDPAAVEMLRRTLETLSFPPALGLAWEIRPERDDPALVGGALTTAGALLRYARLHGGGPEAAEQSGRGVGALMARLALARYAGPLVLTPSTSRYHYVWRAWLGRAGGWGCGSKQSDPSLVTLNLETLSAGNR